MSEVLAISEAKRQLGEVVSRAHLGHEPVYLSKHGRRIAVIVDAEDFDRLRELAEDAEDAAAAHAARQELQETGATPIPWEEVKAELGMT